MSINGLSVHSNLSPSSPSASAPASPPLPHAFHYPSPAPPYLPHPRLPDPSQQTLSSAVFSDSVQNYLLDSGPSGSQFLHSTPSSPTPLPPRSESSLVSRPVLPHENLLTSTPIDDQLSREFPEVANLSKEDLQDLLQDPGYLRAIFIQLPQVRELMRTQQSLIAANESLAEKNLSLRDQLERARDETANAFNHTNTLIHTFREFAKEQANLYQPLEEQASRARFLTAAHESDRLTESLASRFADEGSMEEDAFVKQYREERSRYHRRALVANRWSAGKIRWE